MTQTLMPRDESDLAEAVASARAARTPLSVEGAGTKADVGRPSQTARTLSVARLSGITLYEPAEMVIGARAGTPLREIEEALAARGQRLTFEPMDWRPLLGSLGEATVGGVTATNSSGPRRVQAGACRDSLIGVRLVNGRGEIVKSGGRVMKNVTGLDLVKLMAGSWGTLGVMSEAIFKVLPAAECSATIVLHGLEDPRAVAAMAAALGSPFEVTGAAHLPGAIERVPKTLLRIEGFEASVTYRLERLRAQLASFAHADVLEGETAARLWRAVRDASFLAQPREEAVWRVSIAPSKAPGFIRALAGALAFRHLFDWGGGLVWIAVPPVVSGDAAGAGAIRTALAGTGGHATLVRAGPEIRAVVDVFQPLAPPLAAVCAAIKASLDPDGILNPGRMSAGA
jgi:glycolate oxidase FAD binding subunit